MISDAPRPSVSSLRVDGELRERLLADGRPERRLALACLLLQHGVVPSTVFPDPDLRQLWPEAARCLPARVRLTVWGALPLNTSSLVGRPSFELCLLAGREELAEQIAARTPGAAGAALEAELLLRRGIVPSTLDPSPLSSARLAALREDVQGVVRIAEELAPSPGNDTAEACLLAAAALRRRGERGAARAHLERARGAARGPLPMVGLESLLQHLSRPRLVVRELDLLEPVGWALERPVSGPLWWPALGAVARRLRSLDATIGCVRGEVLTRRVGGRLVPLVGADDLRFRAATLRAGLRVAGLDEVLAIAAELDREAPGNPVVPAYEAELLHWHGRYGEAGARCEEALRRDDCSRWAWIGLAQARMWCGDRAGARRALTTLSARLPDLPTLAAAFGELEWLEGRPEAAVPQLRRAVRSHPTRRAAWLLLTRALAATGQTEEATALAEGLRSVAPEAWLGESPVLATTLDEQIAGLRGNRSSSFVTVFPADAAPLLLQGAALLPPWMARH